MARKKVTRARNLRHGRPIGRAARRYSAAERKHSGDDVTATGTRSGYTAGGLYFEVHGQGEPLFLGFPVMASPGTLPGPENATLTARFLGGLVDRYRVVVADYPSIGRSVTTPPEEFTPARVVDDLLSIADAAGMPRFAYWGGTFGAVAGLQLATRTDRLTALVCAGWPPFGGPYALMHAGSVRNLANPPAHALAILRDAAQYRQWVSFYGGLVDWPEAEAVAGIRCPRLVVYGAQASSSVADLPLPFADLIRRHRPTLDAHGWSVAEVADRDASLILEPEALLPVVRPFLSRALGT